MLALETGWTPDVISGETGVVTDAFRRACHWVIYSRAMRGVLDSVDGIVHASDQAVSPLERAKLGSARIKAAADAAEYRAMLYPVDDDG